ncbi:MAG: hypothetical protein R3F60_24830 [bacterium]
MHRPSPFFAALSARLLVVLGLLGLVACNADDAPRPLRSRIDGQVWFMGPVANATVSLHFSDAAGTLLARVSTATTDEKGEFHFFGLDEESHYLLRAEVGGLSWSRGEAAGTFPDGLVLQAPTGLLEPFSREVAQRDREVAITPLTTLIVAAGEARRSVNRETPLLEAEQAGRSWLGFDAVHTRVGGRDGAVDTAVLHTLLLDAFDGLADRVAAEVGIQPGTTFNPPDLLALLVDDAFGPTPAGVFDGLGVDGPVELDAARTYGFSAATLQSELRDALDLLVVPTGPWSRLEPRDVSGLRTRLGCSGSKLFPPCDEASVDETPPQLVTIEPDPEADPELAGERVFRLTWYDGESAVMNAELERLDGPDGAVLQRYPVEDQERETFTFRVDTRQVLGTSALYLRARATNAAGLTSPPHALRYRVRNVGPGVLDGVVLRVIPGVASGSASNIEVTVEGLVEGLWHPLTTTNTSENGRFQASLTEYQGPLRLTARGLETGDGSFYFDEARGEPVRWAGAQTLTTVIPFYDPELGLPATISPLGDLAVALADAWSRTTDDDFFTAYDDALRRLGLHFGFDDPGATILRALPADPYEDAGGISDAVRYTLALACLAEQARGLGCAGDRCLDADLSDTFTALHLVEMYREDARDGRIDGRLGGEAVARDVADLGPVTLPADPLRHPLASACARWLGDLTRNGTGQTLAHQAGRLQTMAVNDDERLFGPLGEQIEPRPFDQEGPTVRLFVEPLGDGDVSGHEAPREGEPSARDVVAGGVVRLRFLVRDDAAVGRRDDGSPEVEIALLADAPPIALELLDQPQPFGIQTEVELRADLHTERLPAVFEGSRLPVQVVARDALGRESREVFYIRIDREAPRLLLTPPVGVGMPNADAARLNLWFTNHLGDELHFHLSVQDTTPVSVAVNFGDEELLDAVDLPGVDVDLPLHTGVREEGIHVLSVVATDALERETRVEIEVYIDRTPPQYTLQPTTYLDEGHALARCGDGGCAIEIPADSPEVAIDPALYPDGTIPIRKVATLLAPGDPNAVVLRWRVEDPTPACGGCGEVRATADQLTFRVGDEILEPVENDRGERELVLDARRLGLEDGLVDAGTPWPPAGFPPVTLTDLAGNRIDIDIPRFSLEILPPPLLIEPVAPVPQQFVDDLQSLTLAGLVRAVNEGRAIRIGAWRLHNPWPVSVAWTMDPPPPATLTIETVVEPERPEDVLGPDLAAASGDGWTRTQLLNGGCLYRHNPLGFIEPNPDVEAVAVAALVRQADGTMVRELRFPDCRARRFRDLGPIVVAVPWSIGEVSRGQVQSIAGRWGEVGSTESFEVEARVNHVGLAADIAAQLAGDVPLDEVGADLDIKVLYWKSPPPGCVPDLHGLCGGWTFTRRVRRTTAVDLHFSAVRAQRAGDCIEAECDQRAQADGPLVSEVFRSLEE